MNVSAFCQYYAAVYLTECQNWVHRLLAFAIMFCYCGKQCTNDFFMINETVNLCYLSVRAVRPMIIIIGKFKYTAAVYSASKLL